MTCADCFATSPVQAVFCGGCGVRLRDDCPHCQAALAAGHNYCQACGASVQADATPISILGSDRRVVTVLFADVSGYTSLSARLDPERVTEILNAFFKVLTEPIYRCGGVVDKYMGDAIMALFGAPTAHEDDPERAVTAALEMQKAARTYAAELSRETGIELAVRVGLNTGLVIAGAVGTGHKRDYTVMGDAVNVAQRLETAAVPGSVLVGETTFGHTRDRFEYDPLGPINLKGLPEPVRAYRLVAMRAPTRGELRDRTPLIGRESELARLLTALDYLKDGRPQVVALIGEAGTGKSRLAREFIHLARRRQSGRLVRVRCPSFGRDHAFRMVASLVDAWLDLPKTAGPEQLPAALADRARRCDLPEVASTAALVTSLLGLEDGQAAGQTSAADRLSPEQRRNAAFRALNDLLVADARRAPLILAIDDLHWADEGSLEWLNSFVDHISAEECGPLPVLILIQTRPTRSEVTDWARRADLTRIVLRPLLAEDQQALLAAALGLPSDPAKWPPDLRKLADAIVARADGNPLFLWELVKRLLDARALVRGREGWEVARPLEEVDLPTSIKGLVAARLDALPPHVRSGIQVASVIGRSFTPAMLAAVYPGDVDLLISELTNRDFFHLRQTGEVAFNQGVIQEVAYESLLLSVRRDLHRKVAEALEARTGPAVPDAQVLAYHYSLAEVAPKAAFYLYRAGLLALRTFANEDASRAFRDALSFLERDGGIPPSADLRTAVGAKADDRHFDVDQPLIRRRQVLAALAEVELTLGHYAEAREHAQEALGRVMNAIGSGSNGAESHGVTPRASDPGVVREAADLYVLLARILDRQGALQAGLERLEEAIGGLARHAPEVLPRFLLEKSWLEMRRGNYSDGLALANRALESLSTRRDRNRSEAAKLERALAHNNLGGCYYRMNDWERALAHYGEALALRTESRDLLGIADALQNLGLVHYQMGDWPEAASHYARGLALYERLGDVARLLTLELNLGTLQLDMGQVEEAMAHFERAHDLASRTGNGIMVEVARVGLGNALAASKRHDEAIAHLRDGIAGLERIGALEHQPEAQQILGRALLEHGARSEARAHLERGLDLARQVGDRLQAGITLRHLARVMADDGRLPEALVTLKESTDLLSELGGKLEFGRALLSMADLQLRLGKPALSAPLADQAAGLFEQLGAGADLTRARSLLETLTQAV